MTMFNRFYKAIISITIAFLITINLLSCDDHNIFKTEVLNQNSKKGDYIVVLHGITDTTFKMHWLSESLADEGYEVINIYYPSTKYDLKALSKKITAEINQHVNQNKPVHFVGYSMGGLLIRIVLKDYRPKAIGRVVHIAVPNQGSDLADEMKDNEFYKLFYGPSGQQLITDQRHIKELFGEIDYEVGVISGNGISNPLFKSVFIDDTNDGAVPVKRTKLKEMKDFVQVKGVMHEFMPYNNQVKEYTKIFIKNGKFND